jgi:nucleotidyltransferase substrate binding protein (TIGR01987 family)
MPLRTDHLKRCLNTLEAALERLSQAECSSVDYDIFRNAVIKGFELSLETSGQLLRRGLKAYFTNPAAVDDLTYKDVLRQSAKYRLLSPEEVERWFGYRDSRNLTAHDYGVTLAEETLRTLPAFIADARALAVTLEGRLDP